VRAILTGGAHGPALVYSPVFPPGRTTTGANGSSQYTPPTQRDEIAAWEALRTTNEGLIAATTYADWIPLAFTKNGAQIDVNPTACGDFYVPTAGTTDFGMTQIESLDLNLPDQPPRATAIVGSVSTVYGNLGALVLASKAYVDPWTMQRAYAFNAPSGATVPGVAPPSNPVETLDYTHLHLFDIASDPTIARYTASGTVPGDVKNQFSIDEKAGFVRVTTTEQRSGPPRADGKPNEVSHVFVLANDRGALSITGDAGEIAPGEQLYATRYVGDKAYVVTWHVTDPLFVVDVADPRKPRVLGQVQIPGFSTYIHPLDDTHLLTIGRETDSTGHQHNGSYWLGIAIQVFDVTDPLAPALQYKYVYDGGEYATTEAMDNHKAFTYFDDKKLLAFPYVHQGTYGSYGPSSTLEVFKIGVAEGIAKVGSVSHSPLLAPLPNGNYGYCGGYFDGAVRRGVFIGNYVYSISYGGIIASDVSALDLPVSTLKLDAPTLGGLCR
ncbi:MAG: beta-propeller domain-containing protein, partial [Myxococcota bacterium]|nr:beta-propeller domain-containing protein [Myxococcota bacterium]